MDQFRVSTVVQELPEMTSYAFELGHVLENMIWETIVCANRLNDVRGIFIFFWWWWWWRSDDPF